MNKKGTKPQEAKNKIQKDAPIFLKKLGLWLIDWAIFFILILFSTVAWVQYGPTISNWFQEYNKNNNTAQDEEKKNNKSSTETQDYQTQDTSPDYQPSKQLYYSVSCSTCWNDACAHNGYSYGGYDSYYYNYYYSLCKSCSCNSFNARSFWK